MIVSSVTSITTSRQLLRKLAVVTAMAVLTAGCGGTEGEAPASSDAASAPTVVASFYPLAEAARAIGGDDVRVVDLVPAGTSPHELELAPTARAQIVDADAVLYLGRGFQPEIERAAAEGGNSVELLDEVELLKVDAAVPGVVGDVDGEVLDGGVDPHAWVDPVSFQKMVRRIHDAIRGITPESAHADIDARADEYFAELAALDEEFGSGLKDCESRVLVTSHRAFGYLSSRYGLVQAPIAGISPEDEPDPKSIAATATFAKENDVKTVFFEELVPADFAETIAREIGAETSALDPIEGIPADADPSEASYAAIQRANLNALVDGLRCQAPAN
jgi:zinc transport system substrate-binding protein